MVRGQNSGPPMDGSQASRIPSQMEPGQHDMGEPWQLQAASSLRSICYDLSYNQVTNQGVVEFQEFDKGL
jgi:hypothetical protein